MGQLISKMTIIGGLAPLAIGGIGTLIAVLLTTILNFIPLLGTTLYGITYIFYMIGLVGLNMVIAGTVSKDKMTNITY